MENREKKTKGRETVMQTLKEGSWNAQRKTHQTSLQRRRNRDIIIRGGEIHNHEELLSDWLATAKT